jgi:Zn finger protein HypA/HybF involved in hydrogenase expression
MSNSVLKSKGLDILDSLERFECAKCRHLTTLMPGQLEDEVFHRDYKCPGCGTGRDMVIRKSK